MAVDLEKQLTDLGLAHDGNRLRNARLAVQVLEDLQGKEGPALVEALAGVTPITSLQALAKGMSSASRVSNAIADNNWALLEKVWSGADADGQRIQRSVAEAMAADELVTGLAGALKQAQADATAIIAGPPVKPPRVDPPRPDPEQKGKTVLKQAKHEGLDAHEAAELLEEIQAQLDEAVTLDISYSIIGHDR